MNFKKHILLPVACMLCVSVQAQQRLLGGDISLLPDYVERGTVYRDARGEAVEPLKFLRRQGWNAARVRLFVNPGEAPQANKDEGVCQDLDYVVRLSRRIRQAGMQLMLDFHYSDTWADPAKQFTPKAWTGLEPGVLADTVYRYTRRCLQAMKRAGVEPELIQVGNEITNGMLWPTAKLYPGSEEKWDTLCTLLAAGCRACREVCPKARIIIHTEKAGDWDVTHRFYQQLRRRHLDYDVIGLSYYPMWHKDIPNLGRTLRLLSEWFPEHPVMIVETAAYYSHERDPWADADKYSEFYPITVDGQRQFTRELVDELLRHHNVTGLFWWFPEENGSGSDVTTGWLNRGLFDNHTGRVLPAMDELRRYNP